MAKTAEQKAANKAKREALHKTLKQAFADKPVKEYQAIIDKLIADGMDKTAVLAMARTSLTIAGMVEFISTYHNDNASKKAFALGCKGPVYEKEEYTTKSGKTAKRVKLVDGKKVPALDENGQPITIQSQTYAMTYFVNTYFPSWAAAKEDEGSAFDAVDEWENL